MRMYINVTIYPKIMKKSYMHTIIGSSGRDCVLVILLQDWAF